MVLSKVLVVEDELMIRMLIHDMLVDLGHILAGEAGRAPDFVEKRCRISKLGILAPSIRVAPNAYMGSSLRTCSVPLHESG